MPNIPRLGIPRVNSNPQPKIKIGLANRLKVAPANPLKPARLDKPPGFKKAWNTFVNSPSVATPAGTTAQATGSTSAQAVASTPTATPAPSSAPTSSTSPFQVPKYEGANDPRDASYWEALNKLIASDTTKYNTLNQEQTYADSAYKLGSEQAAQARQAQERKLGLSTLTTGLIDSGYHDRTDAEETKSYTNERSQAALTKSQEDLARSATRQALVEGYGTEAAALLGEAAVRYSEAREAEAENNASEAPEAPPTAAPPVVSGQRYNAGGKPIVPKGTKKLPTWTPARPGASNNPSAKGNNKRKKDK